MSAPREITRYVRLNYGNLVTFEEPRFQEGLWETELKVDYPTILRDDRSGERMVRFLSFRKLGRLRFDVSFKPIDITSNQQCAETLTAYLARWRDRTEKIVVQASAGNLARVGRVREALNPMYVIVHNLLLRNEISSQEISAMRKPERSRQYLSLLEQNEIVQKTKAGYTYGNTFTSIVKRVKDEKPSPTNFIESMKEAVVAYIIRENYAVLREVFRVSRLEPYVHMDNCYYEPALQAGRLLYQKEDTLISRYNSIYPSASPLQLRPVINELVEVSALDTEGDYFVGNTQLFAEMQQMQRDIPEFSSLVAQ